MLEPHPHLPILATSGLDNDVKIFYPTNTGEVDAKEIEKVSKFNFSKKALASQIQRKILIDLRVVNHNFSYIHLVITQKREGIKMRSMNA